MRREIGIKFSNDDIPCELANFFNLRLISISSNTNNDLTTNQGNARKDIAWFAIRNMNKIDMGAKTLETCISKIMVGITDYSDQDLTGCVGHARNVDW